jgi:AcrR family transcriptional regulator
VRAAIALADADGLGSVSLRKVGSALDAGPMRLYGYVSTKEELLELMVDAVYAEMANDGKIGSTWRKGLRSIAHRMWRAAAKHKWFIDLLGGRPHLGPHALAYLEAALATLNGAPGFANIDAVMQAASAFNAYVIGAIRNEASDLRAESESGMDETQWQTATWPYIHRMIATGRFPTVAKVVLDASHPPAEVVFDRGLECVLDGIEARLATPSRR